MKKTLSAAAVALLALTACNGANATPEASPNIEPVQHDWNQPLQLNPDGHEIHIMFQWIPEMPDQQPVRARYYMSTSESGDTGIAYVTPFMEYDVMPSMDTDEWERFVYQIPDGGHAIGDAHISDPPNEGRLTCVAVEVNQRVVLDYQESLVGDDKVSCMGFTHDDHEHHERLGTPPVDVEFN